MKGDFSRYTFDPTKNFTRVLQQQGRVQLDSDWNEQAEIFWHYLRTLAADLIGQHGGPRGNELGFKIGLLKKDNKLDDLSIGAGRYYVDGILCENKSLPEQIYQKPEDGSFEQDTAEELEHHALAESETSEEREAIKETLPPPRTPRTRSTTYYNQSGFPLTRAEARERYKLPATPFLLYLDVWERFVSAIEEPGIREVALGGPETAARSQVVWQVRAAPLGEMKEIDCEAFDVEGSWARKFWEALTNRLQPGEKAGSLVAQARKPQAEESTDPCIISPDARYRGAENQLYRVEIHTGTENPQGRPPTFKWSRENGSTVFPILDIQGKTVRLEHLGRDGRAGLQAGDWVEIVSDDYLLLGEAQPLYKVESVDSIGMSVTLKKTPTSFGEAKEQYAKSQSSKNSFLRRWDQRNGDAETGEVRLTSIASKSGKVSLIEAYRKEDWIALEDGIQVMFQANATYRTGDYWLIPARTATGDIEWPRSGKVPLAMPPHGVEHHYAPMAAIFFGKHRDEKGTEVEGLHVIDLRRTFGPTAECLVAPKA
jgi:hypothetical protein